MSEASTMARPTAPDLSAVKARQQAAWSSGNYAVVGTTIQMVGENLCETLDLRAGSRVLDVAAGNGNASLAAARRWCEVTAIDFVPALLEAARARADAEGHVIEFRQADAEQLPFADASFDVVMSTFGVMFTPDQARAAAEMARVCKSGGRIGLANWTPECFIGQVFKIIGRYVPPPQGLHSPALWGTRERLQQLFGEAASEIRITPREFNFRYRTPQHFIDVFRAWYGPMNRTFAALDAAQQAAFNADLLALLQRGNRAHDGTLVLPGEYVDVVIERR